MLTFPERLNRQLGFIQTSCLAYNAGKHDEAIRIGTSLRILIHDTDKSISLLTHLNAKSILLLSTYEQMEKDTYTLSPMATVSDRGVEPPFEKSGIIDFLPVNHWWEQGLYRDFTNGELCRKSIVLAATNKDGGAHVDDKQSNEYQHIAQSGWTWGYDGSIIMMEYHYVYLRQMAYEILNSPDLLALTKLGR